MKALAIKSLVTVGAAALMGAFASIAFAATAPQNTVLPSVSGVARVGEELTADAGTWTGADRFDYQWQRCGSNGAGCVDVSGATGKTYGVRTLDRDHRLRVVVTATNTAGSTKATSGQTRIVAPETSVRRNQRPRLFFLSARMIGPRVHVRFRACDDSHKNLAIVARDVRRGALSMTRRFSTLSPPLECGVYSRTWHPAPRFRVAGRFVVVLQAIDKSGLSSATVRRVVVF